MDIGVPLQPLIPLHHHDDLRRRRSPRPAELAKPPARLVILTAAPSDSLSTGKYEDSLCIAVFLIVFLITHPSGALETVPPDCLT
jgi:hypothetical protein